MSNISEDDGAFHLIKRFRTFRTSIAYNTRKRLFRVSVRCEHWGFVAVAAVDAFHWHSYLFAVSIWLFFTGLLMEFFWGEIE